MAGSGGKFAGLPDVETGVPDVFEDAGVNDIIGVVEVAREEDDAANEDIVRNEIQVDNARHLFERTSVEAKDADMAGVLEGARGAQGYYTILKDIAPETMTERIMRVSKEVSELVKLADEAKEEAATDGQLTQDQRADLDSWQKVTNGLFEGRVKMLDGQQIPSTAFERPEIEAQAMLIAPPITTTLSSMTLARLEERLANLESRMGSTNAYLDAPIATTPILTSFNDIRRTLDALQNPSLIEASIKERTSSMSIDKELDELIGMIPTIQAYMPSLQATIGRLESLSAIHTDAANAVDSIKAAEEDLVDLKQDAMGWRATLETMEKNMENVRQSMQHTSEAVEVAIRDMEKRLR